MLVCRLGPSLKLEDYVFLFVFERVPRAGAIRGFKPTFLRSTFSLRRCDIESNLAITDMRGNSRLRSGLEVTMISCERKLFMFFPVASCVIGEFKHDSPRGIRTSV